MVTTLRGLFWPYWPSLQLFRGETGSCDTGCHTMPNRLLRAIGTAMERDSEGLGGSKSVGKLPWRYADCETNMLAKAARAGYR